MAHTKKTKKKKGKKPGHNPFRNRTHGKRPGHNPFRERGGTSGLISTGLGVVASVVIPDLIESNFLQQWNTGMLGYLADVVLGGAVAYVGGRFLGGGKQFTQGGAFGVAAKISMRALQDIGSSPHNAIAANVRDAQANVATNAAALPAAGMGTAVPWPKQFPPQVMAQGLGRYQAPAQRPIARRR